MLVPLINAPVEMYVGHTNILLRGEGGVPKHVYECHARVLYFGAHIFGVRMHETHIHTQTGKLIY